MDLHIILVIIWAHFISDFILQSDWMAKGKSSDSGILAVHVLVYSIIFTFFGFWYALINGVLHFGTDYVTSRITSKLWKQGKVHWFFVVIGFDQAIHMTCLFTTYLLLVK